MGLPTTKVSFSYYCVAPGVQIKIVPEVLEGKTEVTLNEWDVDYDGIFAITDNPWVVFSELYPRPPIYVEEVQASL